MHVHAARRRQHGDGCHDSQGCRAARTPVAAGRAVHRGLLEKPKPDIVSFLLLSSPRPVVQKGR